MRTLLVILALALAGSADAMDISGPLDQLGQPFKLSSMAEDRLVVVAFLGIECPLGDLYVNRLNELHARYSGRGVCFVAVNSNQHDSYESMVEFSKQLTFRMVKDIGNVVADDFGATRSPEVFLLNAGREVIYRGRIDDQYQPGLHTRPAPTRSDLEVAIQEALAFLPIGVPATEAFGCRIDRVTKAAKTTEITYSKHIAAIFDAKCAGCHRPGEVAPFSLLNYEDASAWTGTIRDVIESNRMPPWSAARNADGIEFTNDCSLTNYEREAILAWLDAGAPEGNPADRPPVRKFVPGWVSRPDVIVTMPKPFEIPKEGLLEYQETIMDPGFSKETWVSAIEIRPGNRKVVHHATLYAKPKGAPDGTFYFDRHGDTFLAMYAPGNTATIMPVGGAKLIPAGWNLHLWVHYTPIGIEQEDRTSVGLTLTSTPSIHIATRLVSDLNLVVLPGEVKTIAAEIKAEEDYALTALYPHMHLRGKSMLFQAIYPNGSRQTLLNVPEYDFEWQHRYVLKSPLSIPAGTTLRCTAVFDNSAANKRNPDSSAVVKYGEATTDEMLVGVFELGHAPAQSPPGKGLAWSVIAIGCLWLAHKRLSAA